MQLIYGAHFLNGEKLFSKKLHGFAVAIAVEVRFRADVVSYEVW